MSPSFAASSFSSKCPFNKVEQLISVDVRKKPRLVFIKLDVWYENAFAYISSFKIPRDQDHMKEYADKLENILEAWYSQIQSTYPVLNILTA